MLDQADVPVVIIAASLVVIVVLLVMYVSAKRKERQGAITLSDLEGRTQERAQELYAEWRNKEYEIVTLEQREIALRAARVLLQEWVSESENSIRSDAIERSHSTILGKVSEHLVPYMAGFSFNPKDVRFIGSPVDLIIFDGLDEGELRRIVVAEVKTGSKAALTKGERQIRDAVNAGKVNWVEIRVERSQLAVNDQKTLSISEGKTSTKPGHRETLQEMLDRLADEARARITARGGL